MADYYFISTTVAMDTSSPAPLQMPRLHRHCRCCYRGYFRLGCSLFDFASAATGSAADSESDRFRRDHIHDKGQSTMDDFGLRWLQDYGSRCRLDPSIRPSTEPSHYSSTTNQLMVERSNISQNYSYCTVYGGKSITTCSTSTNYGKASISITRTLRHDHKKMKH